MSPRKTLWYTGKISDSISYLFCHTIGMLVMLVDFLMTLTPWNEIRMTLCFNDSSHCISLSTVEPSQNNVSVIFCRILPFFIFIPFKWLNDRLQHKGMIYSYKDFCNWNNATDQNRLNCFAFYCNCLIIPNLFSGRKVLFWRLHYSGK